MSTDDRALILGRIHDALRDVPEGERPEDVEVPRAYNIAPDSALGDGAIGVGGAGGVNGVGGASGVSGVGRVGEVTGVGGPGGVSGAGAAAGDLVALFADRAADYRATVVRTGPADLPAVIAQRLRERAVTSLVAPPGLPDGFLSLAAGIEILRDQPPLSVAQLDACDAVVTGAALAMAVTGTLVLDGGPGQGRRALTLLPDYHLCVVRADQIVADLTVAVRRLDSVRPLTFVSGPSATSDVENTRVEGVHGPRTLDIVIVDTDS